MKNTYNLFDPVNQAARKYFGINYLYPYQRLVVSNILEAAQAAGVPLLAEDGFDGGGTFCMDSAGEALAGEPGLYDDDAETGPEAGLEPEDRSSLGRQIVILPTGAGKSLCFQLPAMLLDGVTLVIYPILSLMADQERRLLGRGIKPVILRGGQSAGARQDIRERLVTGRSRFIIANPEVLLTTSVLKMLPELGIVHIVIDEAHCVSEWGESFRPAYLETGKIIEAAAAPVVTAFTATASAEVLEKIDGYIFGSGKDGARCGAHRITGNPDRSNISYSSQGCILRDAAVRELLSRYEKPAIVFCSSRPGSEKLARYLRNTSGTKEVRFYHAGLEREEKTAVEKWFFSSRDGILTATCAYGMGVDKPDIRTVIHRDCPPSVEAYLQESGRAGRDGRSSKAILLWGPEDRQAIERAKTGSDALRFQQLFSYARNVRDCRREQLLDLLNYEGGFSKPDGECCDVCSSKASASLREERPFMDFFRRNKRSFPLNEAASVISDLSCSGGAAGISGKEAKFVMNYFLKSGLLKQSGKFPWRNALTPAGIK